MSIQWVQVHKMDSHSYKCGYCGNDIASEKGYNSNNSQHRIYICHRCSKPTYFIMATAQYPGASIGTPVKYIPNELVDTLFEEARSCYSISAYTFTVMCCRKLLMNIAVAEGAKEGDSYGNYVNYLNEKNFIPPNGKEWVNEIKKMGNTANHKIEIKTKEDAEKILLFTEMLLRFIYEMPGIMSAGSVKEPES